MESTTKIGFTTTAVSTVTIVQATSSGTGTIKLNDVELSRDDAAQGTGCLIYTITNVAAGDHVISQGGKESGLFYVKVEWETVKTVTFINDANWTSVWVWAWNDTENFTGGEWPGVELTANDEGNYVWTTEGNPTQILFTENGSDTNRTGDQPFEDGATYNSKGKVIVLKNFTATLTTDMEGDVYAYAWSGDGQDVTEFLGGWPGTKLEAADGGVYTVNIEAEKAPEKIIFNNNAGGVKTADLAFVDGKAYEFMSTAYTATFTTDAAWDDVYAYAWTTTGEGDAATTVFTEAWPGNKLTAENGVYTFTYKTFGDAPANIQFNGGSDDKKTPDLVFTNGRAYKWNTKLQPLFALEASENAIPAGTTVEVKDGGEVVATLTYGVEGGADFAAPMLRANEEYAGFQNYTGGNGENGSATSGTVYYIKPVYDGSVTVGVWLNANKAFYIQEDGTSLQGFDGLKKDYASSTAFTFAVKAGSTYAIYCTGSKLGFYGFDYTFDKPQVEEFDYEKIAITPEDRSTVESLQSFTLTFGEQAVTVNEDVFPTLADQDGGIALNADGSVSIDFEEAVTAPGNYTLNIPSGAILYNGTALDDLSFTYTIAGGADFTISPAAGEVASLKEFTVEFNNYMVELANDAKAYLFNEETEAEINASVVEAGGKKLIVTLDEEVATPGEWQLNIEGVKRMDTDAEVELIFTYSITESTYTVVGGFDDEGDKDNVIFYKSWDPSLESNDMTKNDDGVYTKKYLDVALEAGTTIYYKVVKNHGWDTTWGFGDNNADYRVTESGNYNITVKFNPDEVLDNGYNLAMELVRLGNPFENAEITSVKFACATEWDNDTDQNFQNDKSVELNNSETAPYVYTGVLDLTGDNRDVLFKLVVNGGGDESDGYAGWIGNNKMTIEASENVEISAAQTWDNGNMRITRTGLHYDKYNLTATWVPNPVYSDNWTLKIEGVGTATGINNVNVDLVNGEVYNLNGQKVQNAQKGLYIVNGRKVVVK